MKNLNPAAKTTTHPLSLSFSLLFSPAEMAKNEASLDSNEAIIDINEQAKEASPARIFSSATRHCRTRRTLEHTNSM